MEKLNGKKKLIVSVFISGRGTNLNSLINLSGELLIYDALNHDINKIKL